MTPANLHSHVHLSESSLCNMQGLRSPLTNLNKYEIHAQSVNESLTHLPLCKLWVELIKEKEKRVRTQQSFHFITLFWDHWFGFKAKEFFSNGQNDADGTNAAPTCTPSILRSKPKMGLHTKLSSQWNAGRRFVHYRSLHMTEVCHCTYVQC